MWIERTVPDAYNATLEAMGFKGVRAFEQGELRVVVNEEYMGVSCYGGRLPTTLELERAFAMWPGRWERWLFGQGSVCHFINCPD